MKLWCSTTEMLLCCKKRRRSPVRPTKARRVIFGEAAFCPGGDCGAGTVLLKNLVW
uniref:Uncharacterized protein n=1 Tax=Anguilla anguilla TaxID=7936 RepID=A0A0E9UXF2_ANGAN